MYDKYLAEYNKLAKKADRRMRELERFSRYDNLDSILNYAYRVARKNIESWTPPTITYDKPRWQRNAPLDTNTLKAKISDIKRFLAFKTSTITGIKQVYIKRADTINSKYGTNFTWQQLATYFDSGIAEKGNDKYGSATMLVSIGKIQADKNKALDIIDKKTTDHITVNDISVRNTVDELLSNYGLEIKDLLE